MSSSLSDFGKSMQTGFTPKVKDVNEDQRLLLPPDLQDWVADDDLAQFVIAAVERVKLTAFKINHRGAGKAQ